MGASGSSERTPRDSDGDNGFQAHSSSFRSLMGKVEDLAPTAQRLFGLGKLYFQSDTPEESRQEKDEFSRLFQTKSDSNPASGSATVEQEAFQLFRPLKKSRTPIHRGQTYVQWKMYHDYQSGYLFCTHKRNVIYIQPIDDFPDFIKNFRFQSRSISVGLFEMLQGFTQVFFGGLDVIVLPGINTETLGWDIASRYHQMTGQKQYLVGDFFPHLQSILPANGACILGFIWTDLFPENYNFVLGEASVKHRAGIFSFGRFPPSCYNSDNPVDLTAVTGDVVWKLIKVVSHEVCHLFGLNHCTYFQCAMNESNSVPEAVSQPLFLCPVCLRKLHCVCGFDVLERYQEMHRFLMDIQRQLPCDSVDKAIKWLEDCLNYLNS